MRTTGSLYGHLLRERELSHPDPPLERQDEKVVNLICLTCIIKMQDKTFTADFASVLNSAMHAT